MTTAELLKALARECPNGVSFDPMAVRLLRQKIPFENGQIEDLKTEMLQLGDGMWFCREMISDDESLLTFQRHATKWLLEHGCFSVERLLENICGALRHISTPENLTAFLRHLGFTVTAGIGEHRRPHPQRVQERRLAGFRPAQQIPLISDFGNHDAGHFRGHHECRGFVSFPAIPPLPAYASS